jgi:UDP-3-O-[3-hydroxymyristoyl] glucosamine N-acyltransferase
MAAQVGISGSTKIGSNCMLGWQVGIAGHLKISNGTKIGAQAGILGDVKEENTAIIGSPAMDFKQFMKSYVVFRKLPEINLQLGKIVKDVDNLKNK